MPQNEPYAVNSTERFICSQCQASYLIAWSCNQGENPLCLECYRNPVEIINPINNPETELRTCDRCTDEFERSDILHVCNPCNDICQYCYDYPYRRCLGCGNWGDADNYEDDMCYSCYDGENNSNNVHNYGYRPNTNFYPQYNPKTLFLGVELEVEGTNHADELMQFSNNERLFYLCHDGSLSNGFEVITHPCDLNFHLHKFPWDKICKFLSSNGYKSHNTSTCGLHVHLSRSALTELQQIKLTYFINSQSDMMTLFSRRGSNGFSEYKVKPLKKGINDNYDRYEAVNFGNKDTVELRMFRGTLKLETLYATFELIVAILEFLSTYSVARLSQQITAKIRFLDFIVNNQKRFTYLFDYANAREII